MLPMMMLSKSNTEDTTNTQMSIDVEGEGDGAPFSCLTQVMVALSWLLVIVTMPFSLFVCMKNCMEYERLVILRLGRLHSKQARGPGLVWMMPCIDNFIKIDLRTLSLDVPPQEILTRDSVTVSVDAVIYYKVANAVTSVTKIEDAHSSTRLLAQTTLRNMLGMRSLSEILVQRDAIVAAMQAILDEATEPWGIKVERVEMKDVRIPVELQRAMAAEAEAAREAKAKVVAAEGERKSSHSLRDAAETISAQPGALQLRYLQTLNSLSSQHNRTIVLPLPVDLIKVWVDSKQAEIRALDRLGCNAAPLPIGSTSTNLARACQTCNRK